MIKVLYKDIIENVLANKTNPFKMILKEIPIKTIIFPDGTKTFRIDISDNNVLTEIFEKNQITVFYYYESPGDFLDLKTITDLLAQNRAVTDLFIAYMPNARMDRIKERTESHALKSFIEYLRTLRVREIFVYDPHSAVTDIMLNHPTLINETFTNHLLRTILESHVSKTFGENNSKFYIAFPDEGSRKRYTDLINECNFKDRIQGIFVGNKVRDWKTGVIKRVDVNIVSGEWEDGEHNVLIIDDICSKGGTFKYFIEAMSKEWGNGINYYLYVSHMEPAIIDGDLLKNDNPMVKNVLTTDSLAHHILYNDEKYKELQNNSLIKIENIEENYLKLFDFKVRYPDGIEENEE